MGGSCEFNLTWYVASQCDVTAWRRKVTWRHSTWCLLVTMSSYICYIQGKWLLKRLFVRNTDKEGTAREGRQCSGVFIDLWLWLIKIAMLSHHIWVRYCISITVLRVYLWILSSLFSWLVGWMGGATTFACKSQECLWQDWYIFV